MLPARSRFDMRMGCKDPVRSCRSKRRADHSHDRDEIQVKFEQETGHLDRQGPGGDRNKGRRRIRQQDHGDDDTQFLQIRDVPVLIHNNYFTLSGPVRMDEQRVEGGIW